jgi:hypothetical protein
MIFPGDILSDGFNQTSNLRRYTEIRPSLGPPVPHVGGVNFRKTYTSVTFKTFKRGLLGVLKVAEGCALRDIGVLTNGQALRH